MDALLLPTVVAAHLQETAALPWYFQLYANEDWWAVWSGFVFLIAAIAFSCLSTSLRAPLPEPWHTPDESFHWDSFLGFAFVMALAAAVGACGRIYMKRAAHEKERVLEQHKNDQVLRPFLLGFGILSAVGAVAQWIGAQSRLRDSGLGNEFWALVAGLLMSNGVSCCGRKLPECLTKKFACHGSFYINVGLVGLAIEGQTLLRLGLPGFLLSWIGTPIVLVASFKFAQRVLHFKPRDPVSIMMCAGLSVCGNSAASAIHSAIGASDPELAIVLAVLTLATTFQIFLVPYIAMGLGVSTRVGAAWIGAAVDSTGAVVASAAMLEDGEGAKEAVAIASTVKMIQNTLIGFIAVAVGSMWKKTEVDDVSEAAEPVAETRIDESDHVKAGSSDQESGLLAPVSSPSVCSWASARELWNRFPKFVLGFLAVSVVLSIISGFDPTLEKQVRLLTSSASSWWFTIGFVCVGLETSWVEIKKKLEGEGGVFRPVLLYCAGQLFDLVLRFGLALLCFGVISP